MKIRVLPFFLVLFLVCQSVCPVSADTTTAGISSAAADTSGTPPQDLSMYISNAIAATEGQNWSSTLLITTRGLAWYPDNAYLLSLQGYTYRKMGQYQRSVDVVSQAIMLEPNEIRFANRGYGYLALGNYSAALADAEAGISHNATYTANYAVKALALNGMGRNSEAISAISEALRQVPGSAHYWHVKGIILSAGGNCDEASAALEKSLEIDPDYVLAYPGFGTASEKLAALNLACNPAHAATSPVKSPLGWIAAAGAFIACCARR